MRIRNTNTQTKFKPFVNYGYDSTAHSMRETQLKINQKLLLALNKYQKKCPIEQISNNLSSIKVLNTNNNNNNNNNINFMQTNFNSFLILLSCFKVYIL